MGGWSPVKKETKIIHFNDVTEEKIVMNKPFLEPSIWLMGIRWLYGKGYSSRPLGHVGILRAIRLPQMTHINDPLRANERYYIKLLELVYQSLWNK